MKPRIRVKARLRWLGQGVPDDAVPGDLVVDSRGYTARVVEGKHNNILFLDDVGNCYKGATLAPGRKVYDNRGAA